MKKTLQKGIADLVILSIMGLLAIVLPVATKLVQENQENRSQAAVSNVCSTVKDRGNVKCASGSRNCLCFVYTNTDGTVKEAKWVCADCASDKTCNYGTGTCVPKPAPAKVCTANTQYKCDGRNLMKCNSTGTAWTLSRECGIDQTCNATTKTCDQKEIKICTANEFKCTNSVLERCNTSGTKYDFVQNCPLGCNSINKGCLGCKADEKPTCTTDGKLNRCLNGNWTISSCPSGQECKSGACVDITCLDGTTNISVGTQRCIGNYMKVCLNTGSFASPGAQCPPGTECSADKTRCVNKTVCSSGELKCEGNYLKRCNTGLTGWVDAGLCKYGCDSTQKKCKGQCGPANSKIINQKPTDTDACSEGVVRFTDSTAASGAYKWTCGGDTMVTQVSCSATTPAKVDGQCSMTTKDTCLKGDFDDISDTSTKYMWLCAGRNGGGTATCSLTIPTSGNVCTPGQKTCTSTLGLKECNSTGSDWNLVPCPWGCDFTKNVCKSGTSVCGNYGTLTECNNAGCSWSYNGNYCQVCTNNTQYKCDGRNLMKCNSSGSGWDISRECGIDQTCNATTKTCESKVGVSCSTEEEDCDQGYYCDPTTKKCKVGCETIRMLGRPLALGAKTCGNTGTSLKNTVISCSTTGKLDLENCKNGCIQKSTLVAECKPSGGTPEIPITPGITVNPEITINPEPPANLTGIILTPNPMNLKVGQKENVNVETIPAGLVASYQWESDDANIASVDMNGKVTGKKPGQAYIIARVEGTSIEENILVVVEEGTTTQCTDYQYSLWGECTNGNQTRTVEGNLPGGCVGQPSNNPGPLSQTCGDPESDVSISFKMAFAGILPNAECIPEYFIPETKVKVDIANVPSNKHEDNIQTNFEETNETDSKGNRIFKVTALTLDKGKFGSVNNFNYVKIKGPWHLRRRMCQDGQDKKIAESTVCNIDLKASNTQVYDFSEYTLLAGDIFTDGIINTLDLSYIKTRLDPGAYHRNECGIEGDLNLDKVVNVYDFNLAKDALTERDDE